MSNLINLPDRVTVLHCSQCEGFGTYRAVSIDANAWQCDTCYHDIDRRDIDLDAGEILTTVHITKGEVRLAWTTRRSTTCHTCGTSNGHHFSVRVGDDMPTNLIPCPADESE